MGTRLEAEQELSGCLRDKCRLARLDKNETETVRTSGVKGEPAEEYEETCEYSSQDANRSIGEHTRRASSDRLSNDSNSSGHSPSSSSNESAFSSASSDCDESADERNSPSLSEEHSLSPSSGRSSATNQTSDSTNNLNDNNQENKPPATWYNNLTPSTEQELRNLVNKIRVNLVGSLTSGDEQYDELDLCELRKNLPERSEDLNQALAFRFITRFINFRGQLSLSELINSEKALDEIAEKVDEFLKFRKHYELNRVLIDQFCKEIYQLNGIFPFGLDKNQLPVLYLRARVHRRWSHQLDETFRRYVAWQVDLITKSYPRARVNNASQRVNGLEKDGSFGICFDCLHVSYSCVDMDFLSYLVKVLINYYPTYCLYALCVDLPWLFRSVWKLVRSWLPEDARNSVHLITSKQLTDFIDKDQIPNSINFNDLPASEKPTEGKHKLPENFNSIRNVDQLAEEIKLCSNEVKQFKAHVEKVLKEYKQLGAI